MLVALLLYTLIERAVGSGLAGQKHVSPRSGRNEAVASNGSDDLRDVEQHSNRPVHTERPASRAKLNCLNKEQRLILELTGVKPEEYVEVMEER